MDKLSQYFMQNSNGTLTRPGRGSFVRSDFVNKPLPTTPDPTNPNRHLPLLDEQKDIQETLKSEVGQNRLDAPDGNKLYVVFLPPSVNSARDITNKWAGHHDYFHYSWTVGNQTHSVPLFYAVIEHPQSGQCCPTGSSGGETNLQDLTEIASHELVEVITDPMFNAWADWSQQSTPEIGDIAQTNPPPGGTMGIDAGYAIQKYYSKADLTSIDPGGTNFQPLQSVLSTFPLTGVNFNLYSEQNGKYVANPVELTGWLSTSGPTTYTYQVLWGTGKQDVRATVWVDGVHDELQIKIYNPEDLSLLFQGAIMAPESNWQAGDLEMSGTIFQPNGQFFAFGTQLYTPPDPQAGTYGGSGGGTPSSHVYPQVHLA
jgi:hypothetical protein